MKKIAILASGTGSNALKIHEYFALTNTAKIDCVLCNNSKAGIIAKAENWKCDVKMINRDNFYNSNEIVDYLKERKVDAIILAGFLWLVPKSLLAAFPNQIINIHPALLPKYGGKGMYGHFVHEAVFEAKEKESGITIHTIDAEYDKGEFLYQESVDITHCKTPEEIASTVLAIEHKNFPRIIESFLLKNA